MDLRKPFIFLCLFMAIFSNSIPAQTPGGNQFEIVYDTADRDFLPNLSGWSPGSEKRRRTTFPSQSFRFSFPGASERTYLSVLITVPAIKMTPEGGPSIAGISFGPSKCFSEGQVFVGKIKSQEVLSGKLTKREPYGFAFESDYQTFATFLRNPDCSFVIEGNSFSLDEDQLSGVRFFLDEFELWLTRKMTFEVTHPFLTNPFPGVNVDYDRFENRTTGRTVIPLEKNNGRLIKSGVIWVPEFTQDAGKNEPLPNAVKLRFVFINKSPSSGDDELKLIILADGERIICNRPVKSDVHGIGPTGWGGVISDKIKEFKGTFVYEVPIATFQKVTHSASIELRIGAYTATVDNTQKDKLMFLGNYVASFKKQTSPSNRGIQSKLPAKNNQKKRQQ